MEETREQKIKAALMAIVKDAIEDHRWLKLDGDVADLARALHPAGGVLEESDGFHIEGGTWFGVVRFEGQEDTPPIEPDEG